MALAFSRRLGLVARSSTFSKCNAAFARFFATKEVPVPTMGDSITEGSINHWKKAVGDYIAADEVIAVIDTDKVSVDINSPISGYIKSFAAGEGETVAVGKLLFVVEEGEAPAGGAQSAEPKKAETPKTEAPKAEAPKAAEAKKADAPKAETSKNPTPVAYPTHGRNEKRVPMTRMRQRIAERLKDAQNTAASLTTFNEIDMGNIMALRSEVNDAFVARHGVKFGFVSAFLKASAMSFQRMPNLNAYLDGKDVVIRDYVDISVAVATPTGLLVPVIRDCEKKTIAELEQELGLLAKRARNNQIALEEMQGGSFTISNGGVYGSMFGTPIINPPQSSILGMHGITDRAVVKNKEIVVRPMMYVALTYDHRMYDGREGVLLLKSVKDYIEDPKKMLLDL